MPIYGEPEGVSVEEGKGREVASPTLMLPKNLPVSYVSPLAHLFPTTAPERRQASGLSLLVHPHMLRHAAVYKLAKSERRYAVAYRHYLGHEKIQHTARYTELAADRFKDFWRDS